MPITININEINQAIDSMSRTLVDTLNRLPKPENTLNPDEKILRLNAISSAVKNSIDKLFMDVDSASHPMLFKRLSVKFHPDRFGSSDPALYTHLNQYDLVGMPQQYINELNKTKAAIAEAEKNSPYAASDLLMLIFSLLKKPLAEYKRYPQPIKAIVNIISWLINIALALTYLLVLTVLGTYTWKVILPIIAADIVQYLFFNKLTSGHYKQAVEDYKNEKTVLASATFAYSKQLKMVVLFQLKARIMILKLSDDDTLATYETTLNTLEKIPVNDFLTAYIEIERNEAIEKKKKSMLFLHEPSEADVQAIVEELTKKHNNNIKRSIAITGVNRLKLMTQSIYSAMVRPLPDGMLNKLMTIALIRPIQTVLAGIFLPLALVSIVFTQVHEIINLAILATLIGIKAASLVILNSPLYALDATRYVGRKMHSVFVPSEQVEPQAADVSSYANAMGQLSGGEEHNETAEPPKPPYQGSSRSMWTRFIPCLGTTVNVDAPEDRLGLD